jgi:hypothetical protein
MSRASTRNERGETCPLEVHLGGAGRRGQLEGQELGPGAHPGELDPRPGLQLTKGGARGGAAEHAAGEREIGQAVAHEEGGAQAAAEAVGRKAHRLGVVFGALDEVLGIFELGQGLVDAEPALGVIACPDLVQGKGLFVRGDDELLSLGVDHARWPLDGAAIGLLPGHGHALEGQRGRGREPVAEQGFLPDAHAEGPHAIGVLADEERSVGRSGLSPGRVHMARGAHRDTALLEVRVARERARVLHHHGLLPFAQRQALFSHGEGRAGHQHGGDVVPLLGVADQHRGERGFVDEMHARGRLSSGG